MADSNTDGIYNLTQPVVASFLQVLEPKAFIENGKAKGDPKYSINLNFPTDSEDLKAIKALAMKLFRAQFPNQPLNATLENGEKIALAVFPFASGDKLADLRAEKGKKDSEYMRGKVVLTSRSKYEPRLSYIDKGKIIDLENDVAKQAAKGKFFNGVEVLAQINLVPYAAVGQNGKPGVTAYLNMVVSTGKGTRVSGGQTASEAFKGYVGAVSAEDPTGPGADEIMDDEIPY